MRILLFAALLLGSAAQAQPPRHATVLDLSAAAGPTLNAGSLAAWRLWGLDHGGRLQAGLGLRASYFFADNLLLDSQTGPANRPALLVMQPRTLALNAAFHLRARVAGPFLLGFNLDAIGLGLGPNRPTDAVLTNPTAPAATPTRLNLLLGGARDRGTLNSELYAGLALPRGLSLRAGWSHLVTGYELDGARYRRFRNLASLGLSWQLP